MRYSAWRRRWGRDASTALSCGYRCGSDRTVTAESAKQGAQSERVHNLHTADHAEPQEQTQYAATARWNSEQVYM